VGEATGAKVASSRRPISRGFTSALLRVKSPALPPMRRGFRRAIIDLPVCVFPNWESLRSEDFVRAIGQSPAFNMGQNEKFE